MFVFLGYPPREMTDVPARVVSCLSRQLQMDPKEFESYGWKSRSWDVHLAAIRTFTGFRPFTADNSQELARWLVEEARRHPSRSEMFAAAVRRCRRLHLELPAEKELQRLVSSAWQQYLSLTCREISERLSPEIREKIDRCLNAAPDEEDRYEWVKASPGKFGMKTILLEIKRLQFINGFEINADVHLGGVSPKPRKFRA